MPKRKNNIRTFIVFTYNGLFPPPPEVLLQPSMCSIAGSLEKPITLEIIYRHPTGIGSDLIGYPIGSSDYVKSRTVTSPTTSPISPLTSSPNFLVSTLTNPQA